MERFLKARRYYISNRDVVLGLGLWSLVVLKDKISVFGPGLGLANKSLVVSLEVASCMS